MDAAAADLGRGVAVPEADLEIFRDGTAAPKAGGEASTECSHSPECNATMTSTPRTPPITANALDDDYDDLVLSRYPSGHFTQGLLDYVPAWAISNDVNALTGSWEEANKPIEVLVKIMERLKVPRMRRKIVARWNCRMELTLLPPLTVDAQGSPTNATAGPTEGQSMRATDLTTPRLSGQASLLTAAPFGSNVSYGDEASTASTSPVSSPGRLRLGEGGCEALVAKDEASTAIATRPTQQWAQKQYFPMGNVKESTFTCGDGSRWNQSDADTGAWEQSSAWIAGQFVQRRHSEALALTMFETRCTLTPQGAAAMLPNCPPNEYAFGAPELSDVPVGAGAQADGAHSACAPVGNAEVAASKVVQLFQWKIVDTDAPYTTLVAKYHLLPV